MTSKDLFWILYDYSIVSGEYALQVVACYGHPLNIKVIEELCGRTITSDDIEQAILGYAMMACYRHQMDSGKIVNSPGLLKGEYSEIWLTAVAPVGQKPNIIGLS